MSCQNQAGWVLRMACTRAEAEALPNADEAFIDLLDPPTIMVDEPDPHAPDDWVMLAYFDAKPDQALVKRIRTLAPSATSHSLEPLPQEDWVTMSQIALEPVRAGRFVALTTDHLGARQPGDIALRIEAGLAFGTGQHMTTHGCLAALSALRRNHDFANIADLGTGTGILAMAAARAWPRARTIATDIDPVAVRVARENLAANRLQHGEGAGQVSLITAAGMAHQALRARAPFDLIIANILAGPLIAMAASIAPALAPGGILVLAGLLDVQKRAVQRAYLNQGLVPFSPLQGARQHHRAEWPTLVLTRPRS
ncbi:ribosomal protein L11 methyltransferase [Polymorphobacter multimanifer]|nr:ribosomal protein L11 methyltransferase [Polymorphobacter multimanifer]